MFKKRLFSVLLTFIALSYGLCSLAETIEKEKGYISVNSTLSKEVMPNQAELVIGITTSDKSLQSASEENKAIANKIYSTIKGLLGAQDYIKTNEYTVKAQYSYTKDNKKILDKYVVTNSVSIKTKNLKLIPKLIDSSIAQGATGVNNLDFSIDSYDSACNDALSELTQRAFSQANVVAKSINSQISGIKSINTTCNPENNSRPYYAMGMKAAMESDSATPIESGKLKIYANIDASFYVK